MTQRFGDRATFAVEVGETRPPSLRIVDLWAAGKRLTVDDNFAYVPSLYQCIRSTAEQARQRDIRPCPYPGRSPEEIFELLEADETEFREQYWFMGWGEIIDNVSRYAYLDDDLVFVFAFWRSEHPFPEDLGKTFVTRIPPDKFESILQEAADLMKLSSLKKQAYERRSLSWLPGAATDGMRVEPVPDRMLNDSIPHLWLCARADD